MQNEWFNAHLGKKLFQTDFPERVLARIFLALAV